jgi:sulfopyruvate decarboxylase TPP-binding subunit
MPNLQLQAIAEQLLRCGITHVVWVPDSELGGLEPLFDPSIHLIPACREGEAMAIAAGLMIGGEKPVVICQCTGFFEAGDAFRNVARELKLPLFVLIGHRNRTAFVEGRSKDTAARYLEPILEAWELPHYLLNIGGDPTVIEEAYRRVCETNAAAAVIIAE